MSCSSYVACNFLIFLVLRTSSGDLYFGVT